MDQEETPVPLPSAPIERFGPNLILQPPLSRRGHGPGLIILVPDYLVLEAVSESLDPSPLQKWAEEGYSVVEVRVSKNGKSSSLVLDIQKGIKALKSHELCDEKQKMGLIVYSIAISSEVATAIEDSPEIVGVASFGELPAIQKPQLLHLAESGITKTTVKSAVTYRYPEVNSSSFVIPGHVDFKPASAAVCHSRSLVFLKEHMGGPYFDLEAIWEEHTNFEFGDRSVANTMGTMVQEPYVNHIPTMTGGVGRERLSNFYRYHFIWNNPDDTMMELVSRTIGIDRIVDEFNFTFTHNKVVDWLIPGIPPTGKKLRIPFTSIVNVRGDRLYHEHISWDQATVLVQLGLMPEYLPFPYPLADGRLPSQGKKFEYRVPAAGVETAEKLVDESAVASNEMFKFQVREVDDN